MIHVGNCLDILPALPECSVQCCVTSPPYFGLRDYGVDGQIGLETLHDCLGWATGQQCGECFVCTMVKVFREVRRVLRDDGTLWLNLGDSYGHGTSASRKASTTSTKISAAQHEAQGGRHGGPAKQLFGIPWRVALALQADGWWLRQDIIWSKPNPMPESVKDRCTKAHEYLFLLTKSERYFFDAEAIKEQVTESTIDRLSQPSLAQQAGSLRVPGKTNGPMKAVGSKRNSFARTTATQGMPGAPAQHRPERESVDYTGTRNKRTVWTVPTKPFSEAHFATYPPELIEPCILAGTRPGDVVLDPFFGAGTTGVVAQRLGREWVGCELNPGYVAIAERRLKATQPGLALAVPA